MTVRARDVTENAFGESLGVTCGVLAGESRRRGSRIRGPQGIVVVLLVMLLAGGCATADGRDPSAKAGMATSIDVDGDGSESEPDEGESEPDESSSEPADDAPDSQPTPGGPTTPEPAAEGGDIHTEVAVDEQEILPTVDLESEVEVEEVATVTILDLTRADVEARTAGEISGPGILVTLLLTNNSDEELDLALVTVNAEDGAALPLSPLTGPPADPFFGPLASGSSAEATYVFGLPDDASAPIAVTVNPAPHTAVAVFSGDPS